MNKRPRLQWLWDVQHGLCAWCGKPMADPVSMFARRQQGGGVRFRDPTLDHVKPRSAGGTHSRANLLAMHSRCNTERGAGPLNDNAQIVHQQVLLALGVAQ